jgi:hypothetical protein
MLHVAMKLEKFAAKFILSASHFTHFSKIKAEASSKEVKRETKALGC